MSRIFYLGALDGLSGPPFIGDPVELVDSHGSGDLLITTIATYGGQVYDTDAMLEQGPTVSGPFVPLAPPVDVVIPATGGAGILVVPVSWSMRWLRLTIGNSSLGEPAFGVVCHLLLPRGNGIGNLKPPP